MPCDPSTPCGDQSEAHKLSTLKLDALPIPERKVELTTIRSRRKKRFIPNMNPSRRSESSS